MTLLRQTCQLPRSWRYLNWSTSVRYNSAALFETRRVNLELQKGSSKSRFFTNDVKAALRNFGDIKDAPPSALTYGISGLIPFASIPAYMISSGIFIPELAYCNLAYGAVILSFLGGIRWGSSLPCPEVNEFKPDWCNLGWAVTPAILAWPALLVPSTYGTLLVASGIAMTVVKDVGTTSYPSWFKSERILLGSLAILALLTTLGCQFLLPPEKQGKTELKN